MKNFLMGTMAAALMVSCASDGALTVPTATRATKQNLQCGHLMLTTLSSSFTTPLRMRHLSRQSICDSERTDSGRRL